MPYPHKSFCKTILNEIKNKEGSAFAEPSFYIMQVLAQSMLPLALW